MFDAGARVGTQRRVGGKSLAGGTDDGQRRAQFMARVAGEFALPIDKGADAADQIVQAPCEQPDLVIGKACSEVRRQSFRLHKNLHRLGTMSAWRLCCPIPTTWTVR